MKSNYSNLFRSHTKLSFNYLLLISTSLLLFQCRKEPETRCQGNIHDIYEIPVSLADTCSYDSDVYASVECGPGTSITAIGSAGGHYVEYYNDNIAQYSFYTHRLRYGGGVLNILFRAQFEGCQALNYTFTEYRRDYIAAPPGQLNYIDSRNTYYSTSQPTFIGEHSKAGLYYDDVWRFDDPRKGQGLVGTEEHPVNIVTVYFSESEGLIDVKMEDGTDRSLYYQVRRP